MRTALAEAVAIRTARVGIPHLEPPLADVIDLAAWVGANPLLTHGSAGNISLKSGGTLWIKSSGRWMADAEKPGFLLPIDIAEARALLREGRDPACEFAGASIETSLHTVLPHEVVLHLHSVNVIAWAVRADALDRLVFPMTGLDWCRVPYVPSGPPLGAAIRNAAEEAPRANVFVLANHGLVLGGKDCHEVRDLLDEVESRLSLEGRALTKPDYCALDRLIRGSGTWKLPADEYIHALATDSVARALLDGGLLFAAQAMLDNFRWPDAYSGLSGPRLETARNRMVARLDGEGVLLNSRITPAEEAMLSSLAQVLLRIPAGAPVRYLPDDEVNDEIRSAACRYREMANVDLRP